MAESFDDGALARLLERLKNGDVSAAQAVWDYFFSRLLRQAAIQSRGTPLRITDEEDVVLSVFESFFGGLREGRFDQLKDRHGLWQLLLTMTRRKVIDHRRRERRLRRGGGHVRGASVFD